MIEPWAYPAMTVTAMLAGFVDAIAGGGGLILMPALLFVGVPPLHALGTNKLQSVFGTGVALRNYWRSGLVDWRRNRITVALVFAGALAGALIVQLIRPQLLNLIIPVLLVGAALYVLISPRMTDEDAHHRVSSAGYAPIGSAIGFYDGFFGPGAGSFLTTALVALFGLGLVSATAHAKLLNLASNIAALITLMIGGQVMWMIGLLMAVASIAGGQVGAHLTLRIGGRMIRPLLVIMALALTVKLLADPANPLTALLTAGG